MINGGYVHDPELLARYADLVPDAQVEMIDSTGLTHTFDDLDLTEQDQVHGFLQAADAALRPLKWRRCEVKKFRPDELPALYSTGADGRFPCAGASASNRSEIANPLWAGVLDNLNRRGQPRGTLPAQLCFNFRNPLVRRLVGLKDRQLLKRSIQMLLCAVVAAGALPPQRPRNGSAQRRPAGADRVGRRGAGKSDGRWLVLSPGGTVSDHLAEIELLLDQAESLENGPAKVVLLEEAVRLADTHGDLQEGFRTREELITAAMFAGQPDVELVAFSWCLSQCDRDPETFPGKRNAVEIQMGPGQRRPLSADLPPADRGHARRYMTRRYERAGSTLHAVQTLRRDLAMYLGDRHKAEEAHVEMERTRRDWLSNCAACVADGTVEYLTFLGRYAEAVERAAAHSDGQAALFRGAAADLRPGARCRCCANTGLRRRWVSTSRAIV